MFLIILNKRRKFSYYFKLALALAILVILLSQLGGVLVQAGDSYRRWINRSHPHGDPIKVYRDIDESIMYPDGPIIRKLKAATGNEGR